MPERQQRRPTITWLTLGAERDLGVSVGRLHAPARCCKTRWLQHQSYEGCAAGLTVIHAHVQVIPRWNGDVPEQRGGIRWVIFARRSRTRPLTGQKVTIPCVVAE